MELASELRRSGSSHRKTARETPVHYGTFDSESARADDPVFTVESRFVANDVVATALQAKVPALHVIGLSYVVHERPGQWWNGACFRAPKKKLVLNNLCMTFISGELTSLVGTSGSGKTSLLDVISGRSDGEVTGVVSYKGEQCTRDVMMQKSSYVLQADRLLPTLTVRETLTYMAYLKLPGNSSLAEIEAKVQSVIMDMGLSHVADNRIGGAVIRGVSGGEKRRITIGVQLLKDPDILLLDEPTSGLDAFTAHHLVSSLADIAHKGKIVIMSIHQPRSDIFNLIDKIAILTMGQLAYLGQPSQMVPYFTSIGYPCPQNQNPCDIYIDITSVDRRTPTLVKDTVNRARNLCSCFADSDLQTAILKRITSGLSHHQLSGVFDEVDGAKADTPSWPRIFTCLLNRMNVHLWRERSFFLGRFLMLPFFVPFILIFLGRLGHNQGSIQDRLGVIYQSSQVPPYVGIINAITLFPMLRDLFYRECHDGLYSTATFLAVYYVHILPFNIIGSVIFTSALYWIAGMNPDLVAFGSFALVCVMLTQFGEILTVAVLGVFRNSQLANNSTALMLSASGLISSGILRTVENMPSVLKWAGYAAIHKYSTEILVGNEFHGLHFNCDTDKTGQQCLEKGDQFLQFYYPNALDQMTRNFVLLGAYSVSGFILAILLFKARGIPTLH